MKKKRVNIELSEDLHTKAKIISVLRGLTMNEYFEKAIEKSVKKEKKVLEKVK